MNDVPLYWSREGYIAMPGDVVSCHVGHLGFKSTFQAVGCPYCSYTPGERIAYLNGQRRASRKEGETDHGSVL